MFFQPGAVRGDVTRAGFLERDGLGAFAGLLRIVGLSLLDRIDAKFDLLAQRVAHLARIGERKVERRAKSHLSCAFEKREFQQPRLRRFAPHLQIQPPAVEIIARLFERFHLCGGQQIYFCHGVFPCSYP